MAGNDPLPYGPPGRSAAHLCIDMQQMFASDTAWNVPWMRRVLPAVLQVARAAPTRTIFTRFIPPRRAEDAPGTWRRYYERWPEFTGERLAPRMLDLLPECAELVPPALVLDKSHYSPFAEPRLRSVLDAWEIDTLVITGGETDVCVVAAVLDAVDAGYRVVVASDGLCSVSDEGHESLLRLFSERFQQQIEVAPAAVIARAWSGAAR